MFEKYDIYKKISNQQTLFLILIGRRDTLCSCLFLKEFLFTKKNTRDVNREQNVIINRLLRKRLLKIDPEWKF